MKFRKKLFVTFAVLSSAYAQAEVNGYFDETDLFTDIPTVSSGSRLEQKTSNSPSSVTVITSEMIAALAPNSLVEVFRLAPSFVSFYINGSLPGVSGHDSTDDDPRRLEVRVNGRSVYLPSYPTVAWESLGITPDDIDRIEMVRGSNVPTYGSNAIMGAINIITKSPLKEAGTHITATFGDRDTRNLNVRHNFSFDGGYGQLRIAQRENAGFEGFDIPGCQRTIDSGLYTAWPLKITDLGDCQKDPNYSPSKTDVLDDDTRVSHMVFNAVLTPNLTDSYTFEAGYSDGRFGLGDGDNVDEFRNDENTSWWLTSAWSRVNKESQWDAHFSFYESDANHELILPLSATDEDLTPAIVTGILGSDPSTNWGLGQRKAQSLEAELQYQFTPLDNVRTLAGVGYKLQRMKSQQQLNRSGYVNNDIVYVFSNTEWQISDRWLTNIGFMVEDHKLDETNISPRMSLHYQITPGHTLRASASKVYRSPSIAEAKREQFYQAGAYMDYHLIGDENLAAEELNELQLAYYGSFFDGRLKIDWRAFHEDMEGAIDHIKWEIPHQGWDPAVEVYANGKAYFFSNAKDWQVSGYDLQLTITPVDSTTIYFQHTNNRVDAWRQKDWDEPEGTRRYHEVPEHVSSILVTHKLDSGWTFAVMGYRQNFTNWRGGKDLDRFRRFDASISKTLSFNEYDLTLNVKVDNIADEEYEEYQDGNFFRRSAYLNAKLQW